MTLQRLLLCCCMMIWLFSKQGFLEWNVQIPSSSFGFCTRELKARLLVIVSCGTNKQAIELFKGMLSMTMRYKATVTSAKATVTSASARLNLTMAASVLRTACAKGVIAVLVSQKFGHTANR